MIVKDNQIKKPCCERIDNLLVDGTLNIVDGEAILSLFSAFQCEPININYCPFCSSEIIFYDDLDTTLDDFIDDENE